MDEKLVKRINDAAVAIRAGLHVSGSVLRKLVVALDESSALEDARRWQHARKLLTVDDIEGAQGSFDSFGGLVSEEECAKADAAIDAAIAEGDKA